MISSDRMENCFIVGKVLRGCCKSEDFFSLLGMPNKKVLLPNNGGKTFLLNYRNDDLKKGICDSLLFS